MAYDGVVTNLEIGSGTYQIQDERVDKMDLKTRNFIFVADSYGGLGWTANVINRLGLTAHALNLGGAGFYAAGGGQTFKQGLETYAGTLTADQKEAVTDIIVLGGVNDFNETTANIGSAIDIFITYAQLTFPNATIGCGCLSWMKRGNDIDGYITRVIPTYQSKFSAASGCYYIPNAYLPMHNYANLDSDGIHPNANGTAAITNWVCDYLMTGDADYIVENSPTITYYGGTSGGIAFNTKMDKTGVDILFSGGQINFASPKTFNDNNALTQIADLSGGCISGHVSTGLSVTGAADLTMTVPALFVSTTSHAYTGVVNLSIYDGRVDVAGWCLDFLSGDNSYATCNTIVLGSSSCHVGLLSC